MNWEINEYRAGNYDEALAQCQEFIQRGKDNYRPYYLIFNERRFVFSEKYRCFFIDYEKALEEDYWQSSTEKAIIHHACALVSVKLNNIEDIAYFIDPVYRFRFILMK